MSLKNPVTSLGIDSGTVRLVAQRLDHYATPGPRLVQVIILKRYDFLKREFSSPFLEACFKQRINHRDIKDLHWSCQLSFLSNFNKN